AWTAALQRLRPDWTGALESDAAGGDTGLWVARFDEAEPPPAVSPVPTLPAAHGPAPEQWLYKPCFVRQSPPRTPETASAGTWIVFEDEPAAAPQGVIADPDGSPIRVIPGQVYEPLSASSYRVRPTSSADLRALLQALIPQSRGPLRMLFQWRLRDGDERFYSMLALAQAVGQEVTGQCSIAVVTRGLFAVTGAEVLDPYESLVAAVAKVLPREQWNCACRVIDLEEDSAKSADTCKWVSQLAASPDGPSLVAIRAGQYWTPWYSPLTAQHAQPLPPRLRREGTYVIFGGLGGVGFSIAR